jgi:hypothetical protein
MHLFVPLGKKPQSLTDFVGRRRRDDLAPGTVRGYRYDLQQFLRWFCRTKGSSSRLEKPSILDLINYRQHLVNDFYLVVDPG